MYEGIFIFGSKLFEKTQSDAVSSLPLELSWKIFLYLDDSSLRNASHANKIWSRIIMAHRKLRSRLNQFELALKLGSKKLARFYKSNKRLLKKLSKKNYLPTGENMVESTKKTDKAKRGGEDILIHTKRFKL
ncbi:uncharacterized protein LOC123874248 [Maniola jurtina]|uniref:uncharacterized protein LOC123874248 n=1 Tax=Maniola jurtina TaxID=191418 RepID=UPI001E689EA4|nr:uncharacterized protein LOC123874248 [Maniola jurtina]